MIPTRTPAPVEPPHAQSRVMPRTRRLRRSPRRGSANGSDQAGALGHRRAAPARVAALGVRRDDVEDVGQQRRLAIGQRAQPSHLLDQPPEGRLVVDIEALGGGADQRLDLLRPRGRARSATARCAAGRSRVALDPGGRDGDGGLAGEDRQQLHVRSEKVGEPRLSRTWRTPTRAVLVQERRGRDGSRDVAGLLGRVPVEARVVGDVGEREGLAGRVHEPGDALGGRHRQPDRAGAMLAGGDAELQPIRILLEERDRCGLGVEEPHRRVDDALKQARLNVAGEATRDSRTPRRRGERG